MKPWKRKENKLWCPDVWHGHNHRSSGLFHIVNHDNGRMWIRGEPFFYFFDRSQRLLLGRRRPSNIVAADGYQPYGNDGWDFVEGMK